MRRNDASYLEPFLSVLPVCVGFLRIIFLVISFHPLTLSDTMFVLYSCRAINFRTKFLFETVIHLESQVIALNYNL